MPDEGGRERYATVRRQWPELFGNPPDAPFAILFEPSLVRAAEAAEETRLKSKGLPGAWSRTGVVYEDLYMIVVRDAVRRPDGSLGTYVRTLPASGAAGAAILPVLDGQVVLLRHFRHATRVWHLEIPRGFGEPGVTADEQARQELREEIGADAEVLVELGKFHSNDGIASDCVELFLAEIQELGQPQTKEGITDIEVHHPDQVAEMIRTSRISDSFTIGAFTRACLRGLLPGQTPTSEPGTSSANLRL
jgi:ADP-ribose pyrophosphatase